MHMSYVTNVAIHTIEIQYHLPSTRISCLGGSVWKWKMMMMKMMLFQHSPALDCKKLKGWRPLVLLPWHIHQWLFAENPWPPGFQVSVLLSRCTTLHHTSESPACELPSTVSCSCKDTLTTLTEWWWHWQKHWVLEYYLLIFKGYLYIGYIEHFS